MIKALEYGPGGPAVVLGLTWANLDRLAAGRPIRFGSGTLGWPGPAFEMWVLGGRTTAAITADLAAAAGLRLPDDTVDDAGLLSAVTAVRRGGGPAAALAVLGVAGPADRALRAGAELTRHLLPLRCGLRLIAGADTDTLGAAITAGKPVRTIVDLRGGRTD